MLVPSMPCLLLMFPSCSRITTSLSLLPQEKVTKLRLPALTPNHAAVVLWVNIGGVFILLGSDPEETGHQGTGWSVILGSSMYPQGKASVFKIPHHGSQTAHHAPVWQ